MAKKQKRTSTSTQVDLFAFGNVQDSRQMTDFAEQSYLDYAMYVILDRALPRIADGLKPVQRRIIYAMSELGLSAGAKYKKSARTVGDVIGKFHPHGDSACYEAMVLMAQPFSYRYPLIDGQGNWGAQDDPKSFAAMRYTESKLMPYAQVLLAEIEKGTVDWAQNFDGTLKEPTILPARLPNILLNGGSGIAVGMATDIPPHNIHEVVNACVHLLDNPKATLTDLCEFIQGPDFPTEAEIITPQSDIFQMYVTGHGSIKQRGLWQKEGDVIAITALPYQVSGTRILEQIAAQIESKKLPMVSDIRDESDSENPTRIVIEPKSNRVDFDALMNHLFATTDLEKSHRVNLNAIGLDGRPKVFNLRMIIEEWLVYRRDTVTRRLQYRLNQVNERLHILDGLLIAFLNIDEVIRIIRTEDDAKPVLIAAFNLTDTQAESILNLRLRHLAKLEEFKIRSEQDELAKEQKKLMSILGSNAKLKKLIRDELLSDAQEYGDDRRSQLVVRGSAKAFDESELISSEAVTVVLSEKGWIRGAKGHDVNPSELSYKQGDSYLQSCQGKTNQSLIALDQTGRSYSLPAHNLPSARGFGEPLSSFFTPPAGVGFSGLVMGNEADKCLLCASNGYGFITTLAEMATKNKKGKASIKASETHPALTPIRIDNVEESLLVAVTTDGYMLAFALNELPELAKGKGNKIINIPSAKLKAGEELLLSAVVVAPNQQLVITAGKRFTRFKFNDLSEYQTERAKRGKKLPKGFQQVSGVSVE